MDESRYEIRKVQIKDVRGTIFKWEYQDGVIRLTGPQLMVAGVQTRRYILEVPVEEWKRLVLELDIKPEPWEPESQVMPATRREFASPFALEPEACSRGGHVMLHVPLPSSIYLEKCQRCGYETWHDMMGGDWDESASEPIIERGEFFPSQGVQSAWRIKRDTSGKWVFDPTAPEAVGEAG